MDALQAALGGRAFACPDHAGEIHFAWHPCNHKACPQCGRAATARWVQRELRKLVNAPYFLVTFTLPPQLRPCFFGPFAKEAYDLFFAAVSGALSEKLASAKGLRASVGGFTAVLRTWNQRLGFHPHISSPGNLHTAGRRICEFVKRYLRHVLPRGLRSIRSYGFCHPAARVKRLRIQPQASSSGQTLITRACSTMGVVAGSASLRSNTPFIVRPRGSHWEDSLRRKPRSHS